MERSEDKRLPNKSNPNQVIPLSEVERLPVFNPNQVLPIPLGEVGELPKYHAKDATSRAVDFQLPPSLRLTSQPITLETVRSEFETHQNNSRAFTISGLLTDDECEYLIDVTEKIGYENKDDIHLEYPKDYRNNQRMIFINQEFADTLWLRIQRHIKGSDISNVTPIGYCSNGCWIPVGINDGIIFSKYSPGQFFKPHKDGLFINKNEDCSIFSVVIYLNDSGGIHKKNRGGNLNFIDPTDQQTVTASFTPQKGSAIIFNSDLMHEGETLYSGYKYMLRTFIMFQNMNRFLDEKNVGNTFNQDAQWKEVVSLFRKIESSDRSKDVEEFTNMYLKAQKLQMERSGSVHDYGRLETKRFPTSDIFRIKILSQLTTKEIMKAMCLNRSWYRACRNNEYWKEQYEILYQTPKELEFSFDFFGLYKEKLFIGALSIMVIGDVCTCLNGDVLDQRAAYTTTTYFTHRTGDWDSSMGRWRTPYSREMQCYLPDMMEPFENLTLQQQRILVRSTSVFQNWFNKDDNELNSSDESIQTLFYFAASSCQRFDKSFRSKKLIIVTFPLLWDSSECVFDDSNLIEQKEVEKNKIFKELPHGKTHFQNTEGKYFRLSTRNYEIIQSNMTKICSQRPLLKDLPVIKLGFLDASLAACAACDCLNSKVVIYQQIVTEKYIQIENIQNQVLEKNVKKTVIDIYEEDIVVNEILLDIEKYGNNVIFISDCETGIQRDLFRTLCVQTLSAKLKEKNDNINIWTPSHVDLYYGAKNYAKRHYDSSWCTLTVAGVRT